MHLLSYSYHWCYCRFFFILFNDSFQKCLILPARNALCIAQSTRTFFWQNWSMSRRNGESHVTNCLKQVDWYLTLVSDFTLKLVFFYFKLACSRPLSKRFKIFQTLVTTVEKEKIYNIETLKINNFYLQIIKNHPNSSSLTAVEYKYLIFSQTFELFFFWRKCEGGIKSFIPFFSQKKSHRMEIV